MTLTFDNRRRPWCVAKSLALTFALIATAAAQSSPPKVIDPVGPIPPQPIPIKPILPPPPGDPVMGFETSSGWIVKSFSGATGIGLTATRTQGSFAFALANPGSQTTLTSQPVASTISPLAGVGNAGAIFEVDVMPPAEPGPGSLKLFVNSPSRGLNHELVGEAGFGGLTAGIYNTVQFPIPDQVRAALGGATFQDLTFEFDLSAAPNTLPVASAAAAPQFLFDNLRVHSVAPPDPTTNTKPRLVTEGRSTWWQTQPRR